MRILMPCGDLPFSVCIVYTKKISYFYCLSFLNASFKQINYNQVSRSFMNELYNLFSSCVVFFSFA